ncbi:MAG: RagB/SusD family nutrient uptake outer membrane protein [Odoribacteraceae bacterium]|jgi:hypothetical protein|nr:RagB/SusD family nutrient uptake outer membrane protein [Odoribacteraceae bacterium]
MKHILYIYSIAAIILLAACSGFLEEFPNDQAYITNTGDLNELLVGDGYMSATTGSDIDYWIHVMDDDAFFTTYNSNRPAHIAFHWWQPDVNTQSTWEAFYKHIGVLNAILDEVERFAGEEGDGYRKVKGEALFLRAVYYYYLVNLYARPYSETTAATDPGVPLKLTSTIEDKRFSRASVETCYRSITSDLNESIRHLKGLVPLTNYRGGEMAARALLSRVALYTSDWETARVQCDTILARGNYRLVDHNTLGPVASSNTVAFNSTETIFTSGAATTSNMDFSYINATKFMPSSELLALFAANDLRRTYYVRGSSLPGYQMIQKYASRVVALCSDIFIIRLPEIYLNRAEALLMLDRAAEAIVDVQVLRANRLSSPPDALSPGGEALMNFIRDERRREFCFEGQRWFDLRRYAVYPKWSLQREIRHVYYDYADITGDLVLKPYDEDARYYVLPIPDSEINLNSGTLEQNPAREWKEPVSHL